MENTPQNKPQVLTMDAVELDYRVRTGAVGDGPARTSFRFDAATWASIDRIAAQANLTWVDWARKAVAARPNIAKMNALRVALADALLAEQFQAMEVEAATGPAELPVWHPIIGDGYHRLDDATLAIELEGAEIVSKDDAFEGFTLIVGYRAKSFGGGGFVCVENRLKGGLHLFLTRED